MERLYYAGDSEIIGQTVVDSVGNDYGKISDILFSSEHKKPIVAVISTNRYFDKDYIALPYQGLRVNPNTKKVMTEIDSQTIQEAPPVDRSALKDGEKDALFRIFSYYGYENVVKEGASTEAEPRNQWYKEGEDTGERHPSNEGSYEITKQYPGQKNSNTEEEADFNKIKGLPKDK